MAQRERKAGLPRVGIGGTALLSVLWCTLAAWYSAHGEGGGDADGDRGGRLGLAGACVRPRGRRAGAAPRTRLRRPRRTGDGPRRHVRAVHHQGDVYDSTLACIPFLLELVADPGVRDRGGIVELLTSIGGIELDDEEELGEHPGEDGEFIPAANYAMAAAAIAAGAGVFLGLVSDPDPEVRLAAPCALASLHPEPARVLTLLRERLTVERDTEVRLALVAAVGQLALRHASLRAETVEWLGWLARAAQDPGLRLAALAQRARCAPGEIPDDVVPWVTGLLEEIRTASAAGTGPGTPGARPRRSSGRCASSWRSTRPGGPPLDRGAAADAARRARRPRRRPDRAGPRPAPQPRPVAARGRDLAVRKSDTGLARAVRGGRPARRRAAPRSRAPAAGGRHLLPGAALRAGRARRRRARGAPGLRSPGPAGGYGAVGRSGREGR